MSELFDQDARRIIPEDVRENGMGTYRIEPAEEVSAENVVISGDDIKVMPKEKKLDPKVMQEIMDRAMRQDQIIENGKVVRPNHEKRNRYRGPSRTKLALYAGGIVLVASGAYAIYQGITSGGGNHMKGKAEVEETHVEVYPHPPIELAGIRSSISLELNASKDRVGVIPGVDMIPFNQEFTLKQDDLETETTATLVPDSMRVEETPDKFIATFDGIMDLSRANIDWTTQEFSGVDMATWSSVSFDTKFMGSVENDALEILQGSGEVAAACAVRDDEVKDVITAGVENFLRIVNPRFDGNKKLEVRIEGLDSKTEGLYVDAVEGLQSIVNGIEDDYEGRADTFEIDISQILDCSKQDIILDNPNIREDSKKEREEDGRHEDELAGRS